MALIERGRFLFFPGRLPDARLSDILDACQSGDFASTARLPELFAGQPSYGTALDALTLMPYVTPRSALVEVGERIRRLVRRDQDLHGSLCIALARSGLLDASELALDIYVRDVTDYEDGSVPSHLSISLEPESRDISYGPWFVPGTFDEFAPERVQYDIGEYAGMVGGRIAAIKKEYPGWLGSCFLRGRPLALDTLAGGLLHALPDAFDNEEVVVGRCILEAFTGFDLSGFYEDSHLNRLGAAEALEHVFEAVDLSRFEPGGRYFFGRRIPD